MPMSPTLLPIQAQQNSMSPQMPYAQQQAPGLNNGTAPGGVAAMVKALFDGQNQYKQQQMIAQRAAQGNQPLASGLPGVSVPMTPNAIPGSPGSAAGLPGMPNGIDPTMQGLFSRIPGAGG